jgi:hypothetical protein
VRNVRSNSLHQLVIGTTATLLHIQMLRQNALLVARRGPSSSAVQPTYEAVDLRQLLQERCCRAVNVLLAAAVDDHNDEHESAHSNSATAALLDCSGSSGSNGSSSSSSSSGRKQRPQQCKAVRLTVTVAHNIAARVWTDGVWLWCNAMNFLRCVH